VHLQILLDTSFTSAPQFATKSELISLLTILILHSGHLPRILLAPEVQLTAAHPFRGIYADIYKGTLRGRLVALRRYVDYQTSKKVLLQCLISGRADMIVLEIYRLHLNMEHLRTPLYSATYRH
jgi:hypothetical protein